MMFNEKTSGAYCTADLWRIAQQSRSVYLGFGLRSLFQKLLPHNLKQSGQSQPQGLRSFTRLVVK
jgi:hypothetical protein